MGGKVVTRACDPEPPLSHDGDCQLARLPDESVGDNAGASILGRPVVRRSSLWLGRRVHSAKPQVEPHGQVEIRGPVAPAP